MSQWLDRLKDKALYELSYHLIRKPNETLNNSLFRRFANIFDQMVRSEFRALRFERKRERGSLPDGQKIGKDSRNGVFQDLPKETLGKCCFEDRERFSS